MSLISTAEEVYRLATSGDEHARLSLVLRGILSSACEDYSDPITGEIRPIEISRFIRSITRQKVIHDRIYGIAAKSESAVKVIISRMRERIAREHVMQSIRDIREVDDASVRWLSRQPGKNLRQKLAYKPYMLAVKRYMTTDTAENRLFREFAVRLCRLLEIRENSLGSRAGCECAEMLKTLQLWLRSDESAEISAWKNVPPNNTLLHDKNYRKIWEAWNEIESLDEKVISDYCSVTAQLAEIIKWEIISVLAANGYRLPQQPVVVSFDGFTVNAELPVTLSTTDGKSAEFVSIDGGFSVSCGAKSFSISSGGCDLVLTVGKSCVNIPLKEASLDVSKLAEPAFGLKNDSRSGPQDSVTLTPESIAVDFSLPSLRYTCGGGIESLPFRLALQFWGDRAVMCDDSSALFIGGDIITSSMSTLLSDARIPDYLKDEAARRLIARLYESVRPSRELAYIVPDYADDFTLSPLRRAVNFSYANAVPVPASIAAVISFQSSDKFPADIQPGAVMLVIEATENFITLTPVKASMSNAEFLKPSIPETLGVTWERHPPVVIPYSRGSSWDSFGDMAGGLGVVGLSEENGRMSTVSLPGLEWRHVEGVKPDSVDVLKMESVISAIRVLKQEHKSSRFTMIIASDNITASSGDMPFPCRVFRSSRLSGAFTLRQWQTRAGEIELWRDHLPELLMSLGSAKIHLVRNASIIPKRNKTQRIKVDYSFELPAGKNSYRFRLQKGEGHEILKYAAELRSNAFPLSKNTECRLDLTYTYGADAPYELTFRPIDGNAGFMAVRAEWIPAGKVEPVDPKDAGLKAPAFPAPKTWHELENFPKKDCSGTSNLMEWFMGAFSSLNNLLCYDPDEIVRKKADDWRRNANADRISGAVTYIGIGSDGNPFFKVDTVLGRVVVFLRGISDPSEVSRIMKGSQVWLKIDYSKQTNSHGDFIGTSMSLSENVSVPDSLMSKFISDAERLRPRLDKDRLYQRLHSARFPAYNIWNGHSLTEYDAPGYFRNGMKTVTETCEKALNSPEIPEKIKDEIFYLLCCMGSDTPAFAVKSLMAFTQKREDFSKYSMHVAYAISDAQTDWQKELFSRVVRVTDGEIDIQRNILLSTLAFAFSRSERLIFTMSPEEWSYVAETLRDRLTEEYERMKSRKPNTWKLCRMLELLLSMLRNRDDERREVRMILAPYSEMAYTFSELVGNISALVVKSGVVLKSFVDIEIDGGKPEAFRNWPDILYALHAYLDSEGNSDVGSIRIKGFMETD